MKKLKWILGATVLVLGCVQSAFAAKPKKTTPTDIITTIEKVNDYWQSHNKPEVRAFWDHAAYYTGNMEAYKLTGKAQYLDYSERWCSHNKWMGATSNNKSKWRYKTYGEGNDFVLFGDWQICFQTYIDMYMMNPAEYKVARAKEVMSHECSMSEYKFWWWADALYMVMPVMTKMYVMTGDKMYLDKLYQNFSWADSLMYDKDEQLYYRDAKYIYPKVKTTSGGKSFWARGDGWVLAGLAKVLADMPKDYEHRDFFVQRFKELAAGVAKVQQKGGYWSRSMLCEADAPGPETSGTAFFTYGFLWGVNHGYLDKKEYAPVIDKAWNYLVTTALQPDGSIGFVQPIGEKPDPTKTVDAKSQAPFGTGAWLLAACEMVRYQDGTVSDNANNKMIVAVKNPTSSQRHQVVELDAKKVFAKLGISGGRQFVVRTKSGMEIPSQLTSEGKILFEAVASPNAATQYTIEKGTPSVYKNVVFGRSFNGADGEEVAWENDKVAYRTYKKSALSGYDVWTKSTPDNILEQRYYDWRKGWAVCNDWKKKGFTKDAEMYQRTHCFHINHGYGMDSYAVGPTLGGGAPALMDGDKLILPNGYTSYQIIDNGPLRFTLKTTYADKVVNGDTVKETRIMTVDKGTHFIKVVVDYQGLKKNVDVASGVVVHKSDTESYYMKESNATGVVAYADLTQEPAEGYGQIYVGCIVPNGVKEVKFLPKNGSKDVAGHVIAVSEQEANAPYTFYYGSAWSEADCPNFEVWKMLIQTEANNLKQPLKVAIL